ncbi:hypothetical protein SAMN00808754_1670 [Thermanaeromonas toyohensis ToBE]|uniref:Uncharacterized protein n=1 Tax=Thermanaeromonas toyohensis ToBE TaxID=698762 RepID=A0A1W1VTY4_9FIRM|nr:hypothetical protein [Thermanaeromonas toyohensis]SMB96818.1 hypothetical protein SAMN00808754_1670 [Thermanaeromonas toyohensis ToBE]
MIKGWSDVVRIPRLGTIALGEKDDRGTPRSLDYFVVPPEVQEVYGPQPRELDIILPSDDLETVFPAYLKRYGDQFGLICRGDGETATVNELYARSSGMEYGIAYRDGQFVDAATGEVLLVERSGDKGWVRIPCPYKSCQHYINKKCREVAVLSVLLPRVPGVLGAYSIDTGSFHSYTNIMNSLLILKQMLGRISFIPLKLKVRMQEVHPEVNGKQIKRRVPIMYIDMGDLTLEKVLQLARERKLLAVASLPSLTSAIELEPYNEDVKPELLYVEEEADVPAEPAEVPKAQPAVQVPAQEEKPEPAVQQAEPEQEAVGEPAGMFPEKTVEQPASREERKIESGQNMVVTVQSGPREARTQRGVWVYCSVTLEDGRNTEVWAVPGTPAVDGLKLAKKGDKLFITVQQAKNGKYAITAAVPATEVEGPETEEDFGFEDIFNNEPF